MTEVEVDDDVALVQQCLAGHHAGFRALMRKYQRLVFSLAVRMVGHPHDAEDLTQDVFVRVFRSLKSFDMGRGLKPWLLTIAANCCRTFLAERARRPTASDTLAHTAATEDSHGAWEASEELASVLAGLCDEYRLAIELFHLQELPLSEVALIMEVPVGTLKVWLHRARKEMAATLSERSKKPS